MTTVNFPQPILTQADIANIITIRNQIDRSKRMLMRFETQALEILRRCGEVEPGMNCAELETEWIDGKAVLRLRINGA